MTDIFVSYTSSDRDWAFWIGRQLEKLGHVPRVHEWEIAAGGDISRWMEERHDSADHILCVVSEAYLKAPYSSWERRAAQWAAATERPNFAVPVFVESCKAPTLLAPIKRCDLHGLSEDDARARLADFMKPATKPTGPLAFPGAKRAVTSGDTPSDRAPVVFPGKADSGRVGTISNIPITVPLHFLGRDEDIAAIDAALKNNNGRAAITALHGLRGVGKTTLAAAYAEQRRGDYRATWWIRAETESTMRADLVGLGVRLGWIAADVKEEAAVAIVMERLRSEGGGILLIYDNANNPNEIRKYLPPGNAAQIIITSNAPNFRAIAAPVEIEVWPKEIGANYLVERTGFSHQRQTALTLSESLGGLPLAHEQAAAYCDRLGITLADYARKLEATPGKFLDDGRAAPVQYHNGLTVAKTFALAIDEATRLHSAAEPLIVYAALLAPEPIPLVLFEQREKFSEPFASLLANDGLDEALASLRVFALIERETISDEREPEIGTDSISLHRLVRKIAVSRFDETTRQRMRGELITSMLAVYPKDVFEEPKVWSRARRLDSHGMALVGKAVSLPDGFELQSADLLSLLLSYRHAALSNYGEAQSLAERALGIRQDRLGKTHPGIVPSLIDLAWVLRDSDSLAHAERLARQAVEISEEKFGPDHIETASSLNALAVILHDQGNLDEAKSLFERDLAISKRELGELHRGTAVSHKSLAQLLHDLNDLPGARFHYEQSLQIFENVLGSDHPDVATSACDLASLLRDEGHFVEALPLYVRALGVMEIALGPMHTETGTILHNLGRLLQAQDRFNEALTLYQRALAIFEQKLGANQAGTQNLIDDLGGLLHDLERFDEALPLYRRALSETERKFGIDDPETAAALNNLGRLLDDQDELEEALPLYRRALKIFEQKLGVDHVETGAVLSNLGLLLHRQNKLDEALPLYQRALRIYEQHLGAVHEETGTALNNLGELFYDQAKFDDALPLFMRALEICEYTSGPNDSDTAIVLSNAARTLRAKGEHKQSRALFQRSRDILKANNG